MHPNPGRARRGIAGATAALFLTSVLVSLAASPVLALGGSEFVNLTNVKRASVGLGPVAFNAAVDEIAIERGNQMAAADVLAHNLTYVSNRLAQLGVCWTNLGEIIAWEKGYPTHDYQRTIDQWWASSGHHAIMVGDYTVAGGSWAVSATGATYSVMVFVRTCAGPAVTPPTVVSHWPTTGATGVTIMPAVAAHFSEAVRGVSTGNFVLRVASTGAVVSGVVSYDATGHTAYLRPAGQLSLATTYRASLSSSIQDASGLPLAWTTWTFSTTRSQGYSPARTLVFAAGIHTGYRFSSTGAILGTRSYTLASASSASTSCYALIVNRSGSWFYVINGIWSGYWLPASTGVSLR